MHTEGWCLLDQFSKVNEKHFNVQGMAGGLIYTVCPKVRDTLFSALCGWILKPFDLMIVHTAGFVLVYDNT